MATKVVTGNCQACGDNYEDVVALDNGEQFCPGCLVARIHDGTMVVGRPGELVACNECGIRIDGPAYCDPCWDERYNDGYSEGESDGTSYCWNCDGIAAYCESCAEEMVATIECSDCGTVKTTEELVGRCFTCEAEVHAECLGLAAPVVTEGGDAVFNDMEITWG